MNKIFKTRALFAGLVFVVFFAGGMVVYASVTTIQIGLYGLGLGGSGMYFKLVPDDNSVSGMGETIALPSTSGRNGQFYVYKAIDGTGGGDDLTITAPSGEYIDGGYTGSVLVPRYRSATFVADEANNTWWVVSYVP